MHHILNKDSLYNKIVLTTIDKDNNMIALLKAVPIIKLTKLDNKQRHLKKRELELPAHKYRLPCRWCSVRVVQPPTLTAVNQNQYGGGPTSSKQVAPSDTSS